MRMDEYRMEYHMASKVLMVEVCGGGQVLVRPRLG